MERCTYSVDVPRELIASDDWRDDPRWDELHDFAEQLFGVSLVASGELLRTGPDEKSSGH